MARRASINRWCSCEESAQSENIEGIEFELCISCEKLSWEPTDAKNFIDASISVNIELENPSAADDNLGNFLTWLDEVLANYESNSNWKLSVDRKNYEEEELLEPVGDGSSLTIKLSISEWAFDVTEDGEEPGWQGLYRSDLGSLSSEELVKGAVRNLWSHMGDYQLYEVAKLVMEHIESQRFRSSSKPTSQANFGSAVSISNNGHEMNGFPESWGKCNNSHGFCSGCDKQT